jgi:hypothetical protein
VASLIGGGASMFVLGLMTRTSTITAAAIGTGLLYGCVLFEMLSGRPPFTGETVSETLADVMKSAAPWQTLSASVPANLQELIRRCLVKEPRQRIRDVGDVRLALEGACETAAPQTTTSATSSAPGGRLAWIAFAVASRAAVALAIPAVRHLREVPPSLSVCARAAPINPRPELTQVGSAARTFTVRVASLTGGGPPPRVFQRGGVPMARPAPNTSDCG